MVKFTEGLKLEILSNEHNKRKFSSGKLEVDDWLKAKAKQSQKKNLNRTKVLIDCSNNILGFYTLVIGQVNFDELPYEISRKLPKGTLPTIKLAWLGVDKSQQGKSLGKRLLASALYDSYQVGILTPFCAVLIDCLDKDIKNFYKSFNFIDIPGHQLKLALSWNHLEKIFLEKPNG